MYIKKWHIVIPVEISLLRAIGFEITKSDEDVSQFINMYLPNMHILDLSQKIVRILNTMGGAKMTKRIIISIDPYPILLLFIANEDFSDNADDLGFKRTFHYKNKELTVSHDLLKFPIAYRNLGNAKEIFKILMQQYINVDIKKIKVFAALSEGGYVWARHFFTADNKYEIDIILKRAKAILEEKQFNAAQILYKRYYDHFPDGKYFPIAQWAALKFMKPVLQGAEWEGTMDFTNPEQLRNFMRYISN